jgi:hypothetical protein
MLLLCVWLFCVLLHDSRTLIMIECMIDVMLPTLGSVLAEWCPNLFCIQENGAVKPKQPSDTSWIIQGISSIDLSTTLVDLWKSLCSPDHFLYICVSTTTTKT